MIPLSLKRILFFLDRTTIEAWKSRIVKRPGESVQLGCEATMDNSPLSISWYKNRTLIDCPNYCPNSRLRKEGTHALEISNLDESDGGNYTCVVVSERDRVSRTLVLLVTNDAEEDPLTIPKSPMISYSLVLATLLSVITVFGFSILILIACFWKNRVRQLKL